jgi:hypothetical protein
MTTAYPWIVTADGLTVTVRLTPKGGRDFIDGVSGSLMAAPCSGRACAQRRVGARPTLLWSRCLPMPLGLRPAELALFPEPRGVSND